MPGRAHDAPVRRQLPGTSLVSQPSRRAIRQDPALARTSSFPRAQALSRAAFHHDDFREPTGTTISELRYLVRMTGKPLEAETEMVEAVVRDGVPEEFRNAQTKIFAATMRLTGWRATPSRPRRAPDLGRVRSGAGFAPLPSISSACSPACRPSPGRSSTISAGAPRRTLQGAMQAAAPLRFSPLALQMIKDANQYDYRHTGRYQLQVSSSTYTRVLWSG